MSKKYRSYFQIDESYFPAVNEDVIRTQPEVWKAYYPHESFIQLLKQTKNVLTNSQRMSIWIEGPYGTGKSHAVLTLKKLLDSSNEELKEYFDRYSSVLSKDLYNDFYSIKNQNKKILTVHRYGSSDVKSDRALMEYVQESIISALKDARFAYFGQAGIRQAMIDWLTETANKNYFNSIIQSEEYRLKFGSSSAETVLENLKTFTSEKALQQLIDQISALGEEKGIRPFVLKKESLKAWVEDVIDKNNLKAIFFIWDEFSDYFNANKGNLSGFQYLAEMSETYPFYFAIVTHKSDIFFEDAKDDVRTKINGRFISPHCSIELPDNMAFVLTGHAMQKSKDPVVAKEWNETVNDLYELTNDSREEVIKTAKIGEAELKGVLPIHPYAALVLKNIAAAFDSNQRSMFDFIKNDSDGGKDIKGFQWFIDNYGPEDDEALLTVDLLWDFFYEKGKDQLAPQIRNILDVFGRTESHALSLAQKRVLKTILLLQAINEKVGDAVPLFIPNDRNLALAFEGTDISSGNVKSLAQGLVREQIIFERPMGNGQSKYSALVSNGNLEEIEKEKERLRGEIRTAKLIEEGEFASDFKLPRYLEIRYPDCDLVTYENIKTTVARLKSHSENHPTQLYTVFTFARNQEESEKIRAEIQRTFDECFEKIVFIDYSSEYLSNDLFAQYIDNMANCGYYKTKDRSQAMSFDKNAKEALRRWKNKVRAGSPRVFSYGDQIGQICNSEIEIQNYLRAFDRKFFPLGLETQVTVIDNMYASNALKQGAECGITGEIKGTFKSSNENTKLEKQFASVWGIDDYWRVRPNELVSKIKNAAETVIHTKFGASSRVSIRDIFEALEEDPFGLVPCNLSAFALGFILKDYANDLYNWSDGLTTVPMSVDKMKEMIDEVLKNAQNPNPKYRDKFIVEMSPEQRAFNKSTSFVFSIDESFCTSVENTMSRVRSTMADLRFPIWVLKYGKFEVSSSHDLLSKVIDLYVQLANNSASERTETDIALDIGKLYLDNPSLAKDFKAILTKDNCTLCMQKYLEQYRGGVLVSYAKDIGDTGSYINEISSKFSEATNWVWNKSTVDEKINDTIVEYAIVKESNGLIVKTSSFSDCMLEWAKKCNGFKVAYASLRGNVGDVYDLLGYLYQITKNRSLYDADKEKFLEALMSLKTSFQSFCEGQIDIIKKIASYYFEGLSDNDIYEICSKNLSDVFVLENSEFLSRVESAVNGYKANLARYKLLSLWKEKTGTEDPMDWSDRYCMPILCVIPASEQETARRAFDTIISQNNDKSRVDEAFDYINGFRHCAELYSSESRDVAFRKAILKNYSPLISDADEFKRTLVKRFPNIKPYHWLGNAAIDEYVQSAAYQQYNNGGSKEVDSIIDSMSPEDLKKYLKTLVKDNMIVGIEIINTKR